MMKEPVRYINNAKELLKKSPIENNIYTDVKYVKSAFGVAYLGVLESINDALLKRGLTRKELPKKVEEYEKAIKKHFGVYNGKLIKEFISLYDELHIAGYYRGLLHRTDTVKAALRGAAEFIEKIGR